MTEYDRWFYTVVWWAGVACAALAIAGFAYAAWAVGR